MKRIALIALVFLSACTVTVKPDETTKRNFEQLTSIINAMASYIEALQQDGTLPRPEELMRRIKIKEGVKAMGKLSEAKENGK